MRRFLLKLLRRKRLARDLDTELAFHREMSAQHQNAVGLGNASLVKEHAFDLWRFILIENLWRDLLYAIRGLASSPALIVSALLSLGLGIGVNTAIFQLLDAVRLKSLPIQNPQQLAEVQIAGGHGGMGMNPGEYPELTWPIWQELRAHQQAFSGLFAWAADGMNVGEGAQMRRVRAIWVSGDFFRVLGVQPWRGRLISPQDEGPCPENVAVVSYSFWQNALGGGALGRTWISRHGDIIGVTPPNFFGLSVGDPFDIALPLCQPKDMPRDLFNLAVMGRLRPRWTIERASQQLKSISPAIFNLTAPTDSSPQAIATFKRFKLTAIPAGHGVSVLREQYSSSLWLLLSITGLVLLIACANLANLLLARASTRDRELAVRLALGASAPRLVQQLFVEGGLLAAIGAVLGISIAPLLTRILVWSLSTEGNVVSLPIAMDWRLLLFTAAVCAVTCLIFGAIPAQRALQTQPGNTLRTAGRGLTANRRRFLMQRVLVITQIAVSLMLLIGALLFVRSFRKLLTFDPGMRESNITVAFLAFGDAHIASDHYLEFQHRLLEEVKSIPGVLNAASTTNIPLLGSSWEHGVRAGSVESVSKFTWVSPGYFDTMGIRLLAGRNFQESDSRSSLRVAVVNQTFARRFFGGISPVGKTLRTVMEPKYPSTVYEIIGVIPDTKYNGLRDVTPPMAFAPASQYPDPSPFEPLVIHSNLPSSHLVATLRRTIAQKHPGIVTTGGNFQSAIRDGMVQERMMAMLSTFFGLLAALLAVIGLYGVISYLVASRRNEFGVRLALGASRSQMIIMVLRDVWTLLAVGILIGAALSLVGGRAVSSLLFGLTAYDPLTLTAATLLLILISLLASFAPAYRASKTDPMIALRYE